MSHLLKNNLKKFFIFFKILIISLILVLFFFGLKNYKGSPIIYLSFSVVFNYLIYFGFRKNSIFFETFLSLLLWLGFWFKLVCTISFTNGLFKEGAGNFSYNSNSFDEVLIISQVGGLAFIIGGYIREFLIFKYPNRIILKNDKNYFFFKNRLKIWLIFFVFVIIVGSSNFYLKIYQKGLFPLKDFYFLFSGTYKWLLLFGLTTISATIIYLEAKNFKKFFIISSLIALFETFISSFSMLSRGMMFNSIAIIFGIYKFSKKINLKNSLIYYFTFIIFFIILFYSSVISVNSIRSNFFYIGKSAEFIKNNPENADLFNQIESSKKSYSDFKEINQEIYYLLINRWVGIDAVMAVSSKRERLNKDFLFNSLKETPDLYGPTFYELNFDVNNLGGSKKLYNNVKGNTLPGVIAFLFYSGSLLFLFFCMVLITILASLIEFVAYKFSSKNIIFASIIGQTIAFRLIHFGYLPNQTYLLFGTIFITIIFVYLFNLLINNN